MPSGRFFEPGPHEILETVKPNVQAVFILSATIPDDMQNWDS